MDILMERKNTDSTIATPAYNEIGYPRIRDREARRPGIVRATMLPGGSVTVHAITATIKDRYSHRRCIPAKPAY
ncbi:MAG: hypothetical protein GX887_04350 [Firmicutes bacterium]|nr:hypothetical protein [Bacillota bacterium]